MYSRICKNCGKPYTGTGKDFCSHACYVESRWGKPKGTVSNNQESIPTEEITPELVQQRIELRKAELAARAEKMEISRMIGDKAAREIFKETILEAASLIQVEPYKLKPAEIVHEKRKPELVVLLSISDVHFLKEVLPSEILNFGGYNREIFDKRLKNYENGVCAWIEILRTAFTIRKLAIAYKGDLADGLEVFPGQRTYQIYDFMKQLFVGGKIFAELEIRLLQRLALDMIYTLSVKGNHGILGGRKGKEEHNTGNLDWGFCTYKNTYKQAVLGKKQYKKHFKDEVSDSEFAVMGIEGWNNLIAHGDQIRMHYSIPYYGLDKFTTSTFSMTTQPLHNVYIGHFHASASLPNPRGKTYINGNWVGLDKYSVRGSYWGSRMPTQKMTVFHRKRGVICDIDIQLDDNPKEKFEVLPIFEVS